MFENYRKVSQLSSQYEKQQHRTELGMKEFVYLYVCAGIS